MAEEADQHIASGMHLGLLVPLWLELLGQEIDRPPAQTPGDDVPTRLEGQDQLVAGAGDVEMVFPAFTGDHSGEGRRLGSRLSEHAAQPVDTGAGGVGDDRPDRVTVRCRSNRQLLFRHLGYDLDDPLVVELPALVEGCDRGIEVSHPASSLGDPTRFRKQLRRREPEHLTSNTCSLQWRTHVRSTGCIQQSPQGPDQEEDQMQMASSQLTVRLVSLLAAICVVFLMIGGSADADIPAPQPMEYVVETGDTLWGIASEVAPPGEDVRRLVHDISRLSGVETGSIVPGQVLLIPAG